jgi:GntR family transcriptional regulator
MDLRDDFAMRTGTRYEEIARFLRAEVASAIPGSRLPSESELCTRFGVSRMTARAALQILDHEGLIIRRRGRGTFVASRPVPRLLGSPLSFTESMRRRGLTTASRLLAAGEVDPTQEDRDALGLAEGERPLVLERLRIASEVPMAIERVILHPSLQAVLDEDLATGSLHAALERMGRIPTRAQAWVSARVADSRERKLLDLEEPAVILSERRVITDQDGRPLEHTETCYAAERYTFEAVLERDESDLLT